MIDWMVGLMGGPHNAQAVAGLFSAVTAAVAVFIAIWNGIITRTNARLSVVPALSLWASYPNAKSPCCEVTISNKGFGPAVVSDFNIFYKGEAVDGWSFQKMENAIKKAFKGYVREIEETSSGEKGHALGAGETQVLARFIVSPGLAQCKPEEFGAIMVEFSLVVEYADIYRRKWLFIVHEHDGYTIRKSILYPSYWSAKKRFPHLLS